MPNEYDPANTYTIGDLTVWVLVGLHSPPARKDEWERLQTSFPRLAKKWAHTHALAIAAGQPAPPMPSAAKLAAGRAAALIAELGALPATEIPAALDAKTPDEQLAIVEHLQKAHEWPAMIAEAHFTVRDVAGVKAAELASASWKSRRFDEKFVSEVRAAIENSAAAGKFFTMGFSVSEPLAGVQISVSTARNPITEEQFSGYGFPGLGGRPVPAAFVTVNVQAWNVDEQGDVQADGFGIMIWKDAAITRAWREENSKPAADSQPRAIARNRLSADPAPFEKKLRACLALQKETRGTFRVNIFATGIGEPPAAPRARTRVIEN